MSFSQMLEILQDKDSSKVVLIKLGHFYIATGRDAVLLRKRSIKRRKITPDF